MLLAVLVLLPLVAAELSHLLLLRVVVLVLVPLAPLVLARPQAFLAAVELALVPLAPLVLAPPEAFLVVVLALAPLALLPAALLVVILAVVLPVVFLLAPVRAHLHLSSQSQLLIRPAPHLVAPAVVAAG